MGSIFHNGHLSRRSFLAALGAGAIAPLLPGGVAAQTRPLHTRPIPASGEVLPLIGLGSWITFNVGNDQQARNNVTEVVRAFFQLGGRMIDSSPMYGSSEEVIGASLARLGAPAALFSASKVWTPWGSAGANQIETSRRLWGVERFDLLQVHNLLAWEDHLETLFAMKRQGKLRYVGITTSHGRRHEELEALMRSHPIDFVQATYNADDREVEQRILPLAAERKIAFIANRPFKGGSLINRVMRHPLPAWAGEIECSNWAQLLLKFVISHPAVTCAIPATSRVDHLRENMGAMQGVLPDAAQRARIAKEIAR